jgi:hypothetical protein
MQLPACLVYPAIKKDPDGNGQQNECTYQYPDCYFTGFDMHTNCYCLAVSKVASAHQQNNKTG